MEYKERRYKVKQCDIGWFKLKKIEGETEKRYCETCEKCVHWCHTEADLKEAVKNNWCIATENRLVYSSLHPHSEDYQPPKQYVGQPEFVSYLVDDDRRGNKRSSFIVGEVRATYDTQTKTSDNDVDDLSDFEL